MLHILAYACKHHLRKGHDRQTELKSKLAVLHTPQIWQNRKAKWRRYEIPEMVNILVHARGLQCNARNMMKRQRVLHVEAVFKHTGDVQDKHC